MDWLKIIHLMSAAASFFGFFIRGVWMLLDSNLLQKKWVKVSPHIIDTVLLLSAFVLLFKSHWSIFEDAWLQAKIIALIIYIGLGMVALRAGNSKSIRFISWCSGLLVFILIVFFAVTKPEFSSTF